jgi:hypothetical protein
VQSGIQIGAASYFVPKADAMIVAVEGGSGIYLFGKNPPAGFGVGGRVEVPIIWGFGVGVGYQSAFVKHPTFPMVTHHAYLSLIYRVDDLPLVIPWAELGGGLLFMVATDRASVTMLETGHFGGGVDFKIGPIVIGATVRYHIYLQTLTVPGAVALGVRVGLRFFE